MDFVAHHVHLDAEAAIGHQGGQVRHLEGVPQGCELACVDQAQWALVGQGIVPGETGGGWWHDGAPEDATPACLRDRPLNE